MIILAYQVQKLQLHIGIQYPYTYIYHGKKGVKELLRKNLKATETWCMTGVVPGQGGVQGLPSSISLQAAVSHWVNREGEKEARAKAGEGGRESLLLDLKQEGGTGLTARGK